MATKNVDNSVNERRLRPIYDWLDNGNNKKALQEADKVLKRQPSLQCAKVLKALALIRLFRTEEADVLLKELHKEEPEDDATLQALAICYREIHQPEMACQIYEAALRKDPSNEEYGSHLFMAYVRIGDYRKQQIAAMNLYKAKSKNPYYFWAVMSIVMQALESNNTVAHTVTLPLAERMIKKFIDENKIEAEAEVMLHLMVLELQGKYADALNVLGGPLAQKLPQNTVNTKTGEYLTKLELWEQAAVFFEERLRENPDHWSNHVKYMESIFQLPNSSEACERGRNFVTSLVEAELVKEKNRVRGPFLAQINFFQMLREKGCTFQWLGDIHQLYKNYVTNFGDKPCCFQDLKPFICNLPQEHWKSFVDFIENTIQLNDASSPLDIRQLSRHLLWFQCSRYLRQYDSTPDEEKISIARQLWQYYLDTSTLNKDLLATDVRLNDVYVLLAAHMLLDVFVSKNGDKHLLYECLAILETARANSPANLHIKLLITRVYTLAGFGRAALRHYEALDIKYIQLDTVGHFLSRPLISLGCPQAASPLLCSALKFYTTHAKETSECLISAYKFGSFEKISEFTKFRQRLNNSLGFAIATVERMFIDLLGESTSYPKLLQAASGMTADPDRDQPNWASLVDNRDSALLISWNPLAKQVLPTVVEKTFSAEVDFARLRNRLLHAFVMAVTSPTDEQHQSVGSTTANGATNGDHGAGPVSTLLLRLLSELDQLSKDFSQKWRTDYSEYDAFVPQLPRIHSYLESRCLEPLLNLLHFAYHIRTNTLDESLTLNFKSALTHLITTAEHPQVTNPLWKEYLSVEYLYNAVETAAFCSMLLCSAHAALIPKKALSKKKKKRDSKDTVLDILFEHFAVLHSSLKSAMEKLEEVIDALDAEKALNSLTLSVNVSSVEVLKNLRQSRTSEMKAIVQEKIKLLSSCSV